ncbi:plasmid mobilization protein [Sneathiella aquimaris]|uniref:plasmid mobilization protein n=1 Tax=Sneathiella aquimaris TaxID=2599305 RepID=UPI00146F090A|nr:hypothetical protein [Sneathiella aquimaris]
MTDPIRTKSLKTHVTVNEKAEIVKRARSVNMTNSDYIRNIIINYRIPRSIIDAKSLLELIGVNADLARLGKLLLLALDESQENIQLQRYTDDLDKLFEGIRETQQKLKQQVLEFKKAI